MSSYGGDAGTTITTTIANGSSLAAAVNLQLNTTTYCGLRLFAIVTPATWTTANYTFQASFDGGTTYVDIIDQDGVEIDAVATAGKATILDPVLFSSLTDIKIRSGTSASAVNQEGDRTLTLILRSI